MAFYYLKYVFVTCAYLGSDQRLRYAQDARGNRIMDFSFAGYRAGGVRLPLLPVIVTVSPSGADDTSNIQAALDQASLVVPDSRGFRGAVLRGNASGKTAINAHQLTKRNSIIFWL